MGGLLLLLFPTCALAIHAGMARNLGALFLVRGSAPANLDSAEKWLRRAISLQQSTVSYRMVGKLQQARGDLTGAMQTWRNAGLTTFAVDVGLQELARTDATEASVWEQEVRATISRPAEWQKLGAAFEQRAEYTKAVDAYHQAHLLTRSSEVAEGGVSESELYFSLARIYKGHFNDLSRAVEAYSMAIEADDFRNHWHRVLSHQELAILLIKDDSKRAVVEAQRAVELMPESFMGHSILGLALYAAYGDLQRGEREIRVAIDLNPQNVWPWMHLGQLYFQAKEYQLAVNAYLEAIKLNPGLKEASDMAVFIRKTYLDE